VRIRKLRGHANITLILALLPEGRPADGGFAYLQLGDGKPIKFYLMRSLFRTLWLLSIAKLNDEHISDDMRGLRKIAAITRAYADQAGDRAVIGVDGARRYLRLSRKAVTKGILEASRDSDIPAPGSMPSIIQAVRGHGYRIGSIAIVLIDHLENPLPPNSSP
jgi:hypothetical protein